MRHVLLPLDEIDQPLASKHLKMSAFFWMPRLAEWYIGEKRVYGWDTCGKQQPAIIYNPVKEFLRNLMQIFPLLAIFVGGEILDMVSNTGAVAKAVLLILLAFSVISWAIILTKWSLLRRARVQSGRFVRAFRKAQRLQDVSAVAEQFKPSPLVAIFENGFAEHKRQGSSMAMQRAM